VTIGPLVSSGLSHVTRIEVVDSADTCKLVGASGTRATSTMTIKSLIATLKPQSNGPSYSNTVIGTLAVDGRAVTFGTARRGSLGGAAAAPGPLLAVPNVTAHPSTASVPTSHYSMWHYNCLWSLKG